MKVESSPKELYCIFENRLSPLLRKNLGHYLPLIGGEDWWKCCVLPSLSPIQLEYVKKQKTLDQFDYPALVNIFYKNWRNIRPMMGVGNELTNYLFTIKTFRNDVEHQPDLKLDAARIELLKRTVRLAERLLSESAGPQTERRIMSLRCSLKKYGLLGVVVLLSVIYFLSKYPSTNLEGQLPSFGKSRFPVGAKDNAPYSLETLECAKLKFALKIADQYRDIVMPDMLFKDEKQQFASQCLSVPYLFEVQIPLNEQNNISQKILRRIQDYQKGTTNITLEDINEPSRNEIYLQSMYAVFVRQGRFPEGGYGKYRSKLIEEIKKIQKEYSMPETGVPTYELIGIVEYRKDESK